MSVEYLQAAAILGDIFAASARVHAMEAANHARRMEGKADAYDEEAFLRESEVMQAGGDRALRLVHKL